MIRLHETPRITADGRRDMPFSRGKYYVLGMFIYTQSLGYIGKFTTLKIAGKCHSIEINSTDDLDVGINRQDLYCN